MDCEVSGKLRIYKYTGRKGDYYITHIDKKTYFVLNKDTSTGKFIDRVNLKTQKPYMLYIGKFKIVNDIIFLL